MIKKDTQMNKEEVLKTIQDHDKLLSKAVELAKKYCVKKDISFDNVSIRCIRPDETIFNVLTTGARSQGPILAFPTSWFWEDSCKCVVQHLETCHGPPMG